MQTDTFTAMGCTCQVSVLGSDPDALAWGRARVHSLDQAWSRFKSGSELSRFNRNAGHWQRVSPDMLTLLHRSLAGWRLSRGLFDPFLGRQIQALGYDRDFDLLKPVGPADSVGAGATAARGRDEHPLSLRRTCRLARIELGYELDSGGIGKGLGAQLVAEELLRHGAIGAMVSLGGDVVVAGSYPDTGWRISVGDPLGRPDAEPISVVLREGSICTSGSLKRRWLDESGQVVHHVLNPRTGQALQSPVAAASAIARTGWQAEVLATVALVGGPEAAGKLAARLGKVGILTWSHAGVMQQIA